MSFNSVETSKERGRPYEKYRFQYGASTAESYTYINGVKDVDEFKAVPISREVYKTSGKVERDQLNIRLPATSEIAQLILPYPPPYEIEVTIWQGHYGDDNDMVVWVGRVLSNSFNEPEVALTCESTLISLKRQANRKRWQVGCPLLLYGTGTGECNAVRDDFTTEAVIADIQDGVPIFEPGWEGPFARKQFVGGMIRWVSDYGVEYRSIRNVTETRIVFNGLMRGLEVGETVKLICGCNHKMTDCDDVFDNIKNYGGNPWIPLQNPVKHANFW